MTAVESHRPIYSREGRTLGAANPVSPRVSTERDKNPGKSAVEMNADGALWRDAQPCTTTCGVCGYSFTGSAGWARAEFAAHLASEHPERVRKRRRRNQPYYDKTPNLDRDEAMVLVRERAAAAVASETRGDEA